MTRLLALRSAGRPKQAEPGRRLDANPGPKVQITTDGLRAHREAVGDAFAGEHVGFASSNDRMIDSNYHGS